MLAEPRRQQKFILNPRSSSWAQDDSKFGQKMLEKMGWSKGKGLGKLEDGGTNPLSVSVKSDKTGVGFENNREGWIEHFDDFNKLLQTLNEGNHSNASNVDSVSSLSKKSKSSKKRVHYKKFAEQKDLSLKDDKDLSCIFGTRISGNSQPITNKDIPSDDKFVNQKVGIHEYFSNKKKSSECNSKIDEIHMGQKNKIKKDKRLDKDEISEESFKDKPIADSHFDDTESIQCILDRNKDGAGTDIKKKKRKNKLEQKEMSDEPEDRKSGVESTHFEDIKNETCIAKSGGEDEVPMVKKEKKRQDKKNKTKTSNKSVNSTYTDGSILLDAVSSERMTQGGVETDQKKRRRKDKKNDKIEVSEKECSAVSTHPEHTEISQCFSETVNQDEVCSAKKKGKRRKKTPDTVETSKGLIGNECSPQGAISESTDNVSCVSEVEVQDAVHTRKKKKRKGHKQEKTETPEEPAVEDALPDTQDEKCEAPKKKKRKTDVCKEPVNNQTNGEGLSPHNGQKRGKQPQKSWRNRDNYDKLRMQEYIKLEKKKLKSNLKNGLDLHNTVIKAECFTGSNISSIMGYSNWSK